jgi:hypothetical protein
MIVGFTGTRTGLTARQRNQLIASLRHHCPNLAVHGDCVGADEQFDSICKLLRIPVVVRPCTFAHLRAFCESESIAPEKPPMQRNRDIVADSDLILACPPNKERIKKGSGTWATIRFAERAGVDLIIIFPDGSTDEKLSKGRGDALGDANLVQGHLGKGLPPT